MRRSVHSLLPVALLAFTACDTLRPLGEDEGNTLRVAIVYGRITDASGVSVANAWVNAQVNYDAMSCRSPGGLSGGAPPLTDSLGRYRKQVTSPLEPKVYCVSVQVTRPGRTVADAVFFGEAASVSMRERVGSVILDSVRVDIALP
jgi:hypothetical protein